MQVKKFLTALVLGNALSMSGVAGATPFTFVFNTPAWTFQNNDGLFGTHGMLGITVDDGSGSNLNKHYLNSEITEISLTAIDGTFFHSWTASTSSLEGNADASYVSTDASGVATLDLQTSIGSSYFRFLDGSFFLQLSSTDVNSPYALNVGVDDANAYVIDSSPENTVPEPSSLALLGVVLAGFAIGRQRRPF